MNKVSFTTLKRIAHPKGDILHALKKSEQDYDSFGEAYFSIINFKEIKGWKKHQKMVLNLVVPVGEVLFFIYEESTMLTTQYRLGGSNHGRLNVPPGYWVAFEGISENPSVILNIASIEHDPKESQTVDISRFTTHE